MDALQRGRYAAERHEGDAARTSNYVRRVTAGGYPRAGPEARERASQSTFGAFAVWPLAMAALGGLIACRAPGGRPVVARLTARHTCCWSRTRPGPTRRSTPRTPAPSPATTRSRWSRPAARTTPTCAPPAPTGATTCGAVSLPGGVARPAAGPRLAGRQGRAEPRRGARRGPVRRAGQGRLARRACATAGRGSSSTCPRTHTSCTRAGRRSTGWRASSEPFRRCARSRGSAAPTSRATACPASGDARLVAVQTLTRRRRRGCARARSLAAGPRARADVDGRRAHDPVRRAERRRGRRPRRRSRGRRRSRPTRCPSLLDERSAQIVAGNLTGGGPADGAGIPGVARYRQGLAAPLGFAIDVTDTGLDTGIAGAGPPRLLRGRREAGHESRRVRARVAPRTPRRTTAAATARTSRRSRRASAPEAGVAARGRAGVQVRHGRRPARRGGGLEDLQLRGRLELPAGGFTSSGRRRRTPAARGSRTTRGATATSAATAPTRASSTSSSATPSPATGGNQEMVEVVRGRERRGRPVAARRTRAGRASPLRAPPRTSSRSAPRRAARPLGQITCGLDDGGADQRGRHHRLLEPRPDQRRSHEAGRGRARHEDRGRGPADRGAYQGAGVCTKFFEGTLLLARVRHLTGSARRVGSRRADPRTGTTGEHGPPPSPR